MDAPPNLTKQLETILLSVQKPGRYIGGEWNSIVKDWSSVRSHLCLVFPDIYDIGLSNLGMGILYEEINSRPDALVERAYAPWTDMEEKLREIDLPLFSLESKRPLASFDILGFTLPYETLYTNVLNLLHLSKIPIHSSDRTSTDPLIIAGGHATYNPEPMHAFIDAFVIGEGENVIHEIIDTQMSWMEMKASRDELLSMLAGIQGVYIPSLYNVSYNSDGTIKRFISLSPKANIHIVKQIIPTLPKPLVRHIIPNISIVHDRVAIEIMRGCTRGCRFCQAGMVTRPVRERPLTDIMEAVGKGVKSTGTNEVALLSLSSSDYSNIVELVNQISNNYCNDHLTISLPSLRIESVSVQLLDKIQHSRSGGFTLAPEAASEHLRNKINKPISNEQLIKITSEIYNRGWTVIKLYFMIGLPDETMEDVEAIVRLCKTAISSGKQVHGSRAGLHVSVGTFVPKPHTPFQWFSCNSINTIRIKQNYLKNALKVKGIKYSWTDPYVTQLEAQLSRGDRRLSTVIYDAWKMGAKFDAWHEHFNYQLWNDAYNKNSLSPGFYSQRTREETEIFPWDHIQIGVSKKYLRKEFEANLLGKTTDDCRNLCLNCGILPAYKELRVRNSSELWKCPTIKKDNTVLED